MPENPAPSTKLTRNELKAVDRALSDTISLLIALADDTPYPDDPRWTPWTRFQKPLAERCRRARKPVRDRLRDLHASDETHSKEETRTVVCPEGRMYEITLCGLCDLQAERNVADRWECPRHGDRITIRVAGVRRAGLMLGEPLALDEKEDTA